MRSGRARWMALVVMSLAGCSRYATATQSSPRPPAAAASRAHATVTPENGPVTPSGRAASPLASPASAQPSPAASQSAASTAPAQTALPVPVGKRVVIPMLSPDAPPKILSVAMSETTVHSGDTVSGTVLTTSNVASVEVRIANYGQGLTKTGVGRFFLSYPVSLPFFVRGTFDMRVIARNTRGTTAQTTIPITVR